MSMYPSIEDLVVDTQAHAYVAAEKQQAAIQSNTNNGVPVSGGLYSGLGLEDLLSYGGLDISPLKIQEQMGQELALQLANPRPSSNGGYQPLVKLTNDNNLGIIRSEKKEGVRPIVLCKNDKQKVGLAPAAIDKGVFVAFVWNESPAALAGIRFGDQILAINGAPVAGWTAKQVIKCFEKADTNGIMIAVRDRPMSRTITFQKDSNNVIGFYVKKGEISDIVKDSSAARNGLLIKHMIAEVNGQNVVGLDDKDLIKIMQSAPVTITLTIMPTFVFKHLVEKISFKKLKQYMDHGVPEV
eukprot:m.208203 g.208203  ORF g.208203 m.208203 type:complete len:298 (+) comp33002_c6_seq2:84-977(+)